MSHLTSSALQPGQQIGPYTVLSTLGSGGMGEVYRARDATLNRDVAIKVLPSAFTSDPYRLARFEREAHILASLNHPNIETIHGVERGTGVHALVLEVVDGETLAERLERETRRPGIPVSKALDIARQIAEALEAAHDKGIIHRDEAGQHQSVPMAWSKCSTSDWRKRSPPTRTPMPYSRRR